MSHLPADDVFHDHDRDAHEGDGKQVGQDEGGAPVGAGEIGEFPDVAQADGGTQGGGKSAEGGRKGVQIIGPENRHDGSLSIY